MQNTPQVSPREFVESFREETESFLASVMEAVNHAADGEWIVGSEERVRDLWAEFRQQVFQAAVQKRIDAAEAASSLSAGKRDRCGAPATADQTAPE